MPPNLKHTPLAPGTWPFHLSWLPETAHLVGGVVRDALLARQPDYLDLDFVLPEGAIETAQAIAQHYHAGFVVLDAERQIARVVFEAATVDFALQEGESLEQDLGRRDFTINAIAYSPHRQTLVDPLGGYGDLQARQLRMVSRQNLADDPLRLLRAYRQAAQLGFELEASTATAIQSLAPQIARVAAERVQSELSTLLSSAQGTPWLALAWEAGLLRSWLPDIDPDRLTRLRWLDALAPLLQLRLPALARSPYPKSSLGKQGPIPLVKLLLLTASEGDRPAVEAPAPPDAQPKPQPRTQTRNQARNQADPQAEHQSETRAEAQVQGLKFSRVETRAALAVARLLPQLRAETLSLRGQYFLFQEAGELFPVLALVRWAELLQRLAGPPDAAAIARWTQPEFASDAPALQWLMGLLGRYLNPADPLAHPSPLLSGQDLIQQLQIKPGPEIGLLLTELQISQAEGQVANRAAAIAWVEAYRAQCQ